MDYLLPHPHSSQIRTLPASALGVVSFSPQLLAGPPLRASDAALPDTEPGTHSPGVPFFETLTQPSPLLPTRPFLRPRVPPSIVPPAPSTPSWRVAARVGPLSRLPLYIFGGGRWRSRAKRLSKNCSPPKPYIGTTRIRPKIFPRVLRP